MNILVIEDEELIRQGLRDLLEINGHTVLAAVDGAEGVKLAESRPPDLILCDINMPKMDGYQTITEIQKRPPCRDIPFIFLTAMGDRAAQRRGMAMGADDYITKPFTERELLEAIAARINRQRPLRERIGQLIEQRHREISADWSHELLTPLNGVFGGLQLIEMEGAGVSPAELKELLGLIRAGAERQQRLSRKLIRYFELERMKQSPRPAGTFRCNAKTVVEAAAAQVAKEANREGDLRIECEPGDVALPEAFLTDAVAELAGNAFCFSAKGRPVTVSGLRSDRTYRIEMIDEGPGMTPAQRESVEAFTQFDRGTRNQQGLGLGIAIARGVAAMGGGRLTLEPGPGGQGLRATLELQCAPEADVNAGER